MSLLRTASHVAVASAVNGRVRQRQMRRMAGLGAAPAPAAAPEVTPPPAPAAPPPAAADRIALLRQLGELRDAGVRTTEEFETQKARLLA
ncbi:MAG: hypothetical protein BGO37_00605 [Cellulomonas sp. 73-92]|uniref:SHOCT domain-containing protein n=1 Tax=Cellulomonas sp. 73-92 TaxID=1895740 RepID=UPI000929BA56|nr:SHOCT domain-containing protein [Cellulomonas sp. 73-92]OJV78894.1 MAG: hypothetical protein BGO37_00605 [Cellulomonas sp. 73-92]